VPGSASRQNTRVATVALESDNHFSRLGFALTSLASRAQMGGQEPMGMLVFTHLAVNIHGVRAAIAGLCAVLCCLLTICCAALGHSNHLRNTLQL
jgi:hypothetical protein